MFYGLGRDAAAAGASAAPVLAARTLPSGKGPEPSPWVHIFKIRVVVWPSEGTV